MSLIGVFNRDQAVDAQVRSSLLTKKGFFLKFFSDSAEFLEFLNFELPEIVIINLCDEHGELMKVVESVRTDAWLHNFGIIGIYDRHVEKEESLLEKFKEINILTVLSKDRLATHLEKGVEIIERNRQIIFQLELTDKLVEKGTGAFTIDNDPLSVPIYAGLAATTLMQRGLVNADLRVQLQVVLTELLLNAIEHGNCGITMDEKSEILREGKSILDLVADKCLDPEIQKRRVYFEWQSDNDGTMFLIRDEGDGFNVKAMQERLENQGPEALNGRGMLMARRLAKKFAYNQKGNQVKMFFAHPQRPANRTPEGFSTEEVVTVKPGDIIFKENELSNFLYYIAAGKFEVLHNGTIVGLLTAADIFMGEMSFLMNNRRSATVRAITPGRLLKISRKSFVSVVKEYPHYGIFLSKLLARKLSRANDEATHRMERAV
ncbi:MAG: cyclic nucleotide-binding domain-containing protein [Spirochaetales bacterium]|nr:cyclic nucleotide-binding domain-containing protein [Spirochaetales bacterium]